jgi:hypothetical protein
LVITLSLYLLDTYRQNRRCPINSTNIDRPQSITCTRKWCPKGTLLEVTLTILSLPFFAQSSSRFYFPALGLLQTSTWTLGYCATSFLQTAQTFCSVRGWNLSSVFEFLTPPQAATLFDQHRESQQQLACEILRTCDQWSATGRKETSRLVAAMQTACWILHSFVCFNCFNPEELVQLGFHSHADGIWLSWTMLDPCLASLSEFSSKYRAVEWCGMVWMCRHRLLELVSDVAQLELG